MSRAFQISPFTVQIKPSCIWLVAILLVWLWFLFATILYLDKWCYLFLPVASWLAVRIIRQNGWWGSKERIHSIGIDEEGRLFVYYHEFAVEATVLDDCFITAWLVVLNVRMDEIKRSFMIWTDSASLEDRRRLRVYLRWFRMQQEE